MQTPSISSPIPQRMNQLSVTSTLTADMSSGHPSNGPFTDAISQADSLTNNETCISVEMVRPAQAQVKTEPEVILYEETTDQAAVVQVKRENVDEAPKQSRRQANKMIATSLMLAQQKLKQIRQHHSTWTASTSDVKVIDEVLTLLDQVDIQRHRLEGQPEDTKEVNPQLIPLIRTEELEEVDGPVELPSDTDVLTWEAENSILDVGEITRTLTMDAAIWIPVFDGHHWCDFINKFEDLRRHLSWTDEQSRAYLLRSLRPPIQALARTMKTWRYDAMVVYLTEVTAPAKPRLEAIEELLQIRRKKTEDLRALALRVTSKAATIPLVDTQRNVLKAAVFRGALADDLLLLNHLENVKYQCPRFADQLQAALAYETNYRCMPTADTSSVSSLANESQTPTETGAANSPASPPVASVKPSESKLLNIPNVARINPPVSL